MPDFDPAAEVRPPRGRRPWNMLATAYEGQRDALRHCLKRYGRFRGSGYRNILIGDVPDRTAFLDALRDGLAADERLRMALGKMVPIDQVVPITADTAVDDLATAAVPFLDALATGTFYVRIERRGLRHQLHSSEAERAVGERLVAALTARGGTPKVSFKDPDFVVAIETIGEEAGLGLLPRALRAAYPFVRMK